MPHDPLQAAINALREAEAQLIDVNLNGRGEVHEKAIRKSISAVVRITSDLVNVYHSGQKSA